MGQKTPLTTGVDSVTGTSGNDTINGSDTTVTGLDVVNGGAGTDTLNISDVAGAAADLSLLSVSNVENLVLTSTTSLDGAAANVSGWTGLTSAKFDLRSVAADQAVTAADTTAVEVTAKVTTAAALTVNGGSTVSASVNNTVDNSAKTITVLGGAATSAVTVAQTAATATHAAAVTITDKNAADDTKADTITTVTLSGLKGGVAAINSDALATLNLSSSDQNVTIDNDTADHALALNLNGVTGGIISDVKAKTVTVTNTTTASSGITVTADLATAITFAGDKAISTSLGATQAANLVITSTNTAGTTILTALDNDVTFTGAAGADAVTIGATTKAITMGEGNDTVTISSGVTALGTGGSVDAGAGDADVLAMDAADAVTASSATTFEGTIAGFERLSVGAIAAAAVTSEIKLANLDDINYVTLAGAADNTAGAAVTTISGFTTGGTFELTAALDGGTNNNDVTLSGAGFTAGTADTFNLKFSATNGFANVSNLTLAKVETVAITTDDTDTTAATTAFTGLLQIADTKTVTVAGDAGFDFTGSDLSAMTSLDASGVTATGAGGAITVTAAVAATITGGAGDDVIVGSSGADTIVGGAGADTITTGGGLDTITGGAGNDTFIITAPANGNSYATITDATAGDKLQFANQGTETFATAKKVLAGTAVFQDYLDAAAAATNAAANGNYAWFQWAGDTYLVQDNSDNATFTNGTDIVVKLTGLIDLSTATGGTTNELTLA